LEWNRGGAIQNRACGETDNSLNGNMINWFLSVFASNSIRRQFRKSPGARLRRGFGSALPGTPAQFRDDSRRYLVNRVFSELLVGENIGGPPGNQADVVFRQLGGDSSRRERKQRGNDQPQVVEDILKHCDLWIKPEERAPPVFTLEPEYIPMDEFLANF